MFVLFCFFFNNSCYGTFVCMYQLRGTNEKLGSHPNLAHPRSYKTMVISILNVCWYDITVGFITTTLSITVMLPQMLVYFDVDHFSNSRSPRSSWISFTLAVDGDLRSEEVRERKTERKKKVSAYSKIDNSCQQVKYMSG